MNKPTIHGAFGKNRSRCGLYIGRVALSRDYRRVTCKLCRRLRKHCGF